MTLPPLPDNASQRWFYHYQNAVARHVMMIRGTSSANTADADDLVIDLLGAIGGQFGLNEFYAVEHAAAGSDLRFPVASDRIGDTFGSGTMLAEWNATAATFVGRSGGGYRGRIVLFGWKGVTSAFRLTSAEESQVADAVAVLNSHTATPATKEELPATWYPYVDIKPNDHWVRKARNG